MRTFFVAILALVSLSSVASARTIKQVHVTRVSAGLYRVDGTDTLVKAKGCTDTASGTPAMLDDNGAFSELHFMDDSGEVEDSCDVSIPHVSLKSNRTHQVNRQVASK